MQTYKLLIFLAVWRRPEITEICFKGIQRLKAYSKHPIEAFAVISEKKMIPLCEKYGIEYTTYKNEPLGEKKNYGLKQAFKKEWDYMIEIGSDDLLKNEYIDAVQEKFGVWDLFGIDHVIYINSEDGACRKYKTKHPFGLGRVISRKVVNKVGTDLWSNRLGKGLDNNSMFFMGRNGFGMCQVRTDIPLAIDIKSQENIWKFNYLIGQEYELEKALEGLSEGEVESIKSLCRVEV